MQRKWMIALASMFTFSVAVAGISMADDEEGPLAQLMTKVNTKASLIKKHTRTAVAYKKGQKEIAPATEELLKLSKEARGLGKEAMKKAKNVKDGEKQWADLSENFTKELEKFSALMAKPTTTQEQAKKAFQGGVGQSCTKCHEVFKVEEESF